MFVSEQVVAPDLIDAEVLSAFRRMERFGQLSSTRAAEVVADLQAAPIERVRTTDLTIATWSLRSNLTPY